MPSNSSSPSRVYLLRHAEAGLARPGERDFDRSLNDNGYAAAELVADMAADKGYVPDLVISSTALRCRQTAEAIRRAVVGPDVEFLYVDGLYNATLDVYLEIIESHATDRAVMVVGHNPTMELVLETLIGQDALMAALPNGFPTAGLAVIDASGTAAPSAASWILRDFLTE